MQRTIYPRGGKPSFFLMLLVLFIFLASPRQLHAQGCLVSGGTISIEGPTSFCSGDGEPDIVEVAVSGSSGTYSAILLTDHYGFISEIHNSTIIDLEGGYSGTFVVLHLSYEAGITGLAVNGNIQNLGGCFSLSSNSLSVTRYGFEAGTITTLNGLADTAVCVDDGRNDYLTIRITGSDGLARVWATTDLSGNIIRLDFPPGPNYEGSGPGVVQLYAIQFCYSLNGIAPGTNIADLPATADASNPITVTKNINCCYRENKDCKNRVLICANNRSVCVNRKHLDDWLAGGATIGACFVCPGMQTASLAKEGTEKSEPPGGFQVYPNPARSGFWIAYPFRGAASLELLTAGGQTIWKKSYGSISLNSMYVSLEHLNLKPGVYYLVLRSRDRTRSGAVVIM